MKNNLLTILLSILIGFLLTKFTFNQYETDYNLTTVFNSNEEVTFLKLGIFDKLDNIDITNYIYNTIDNKYHVYIGITKDKENIKKIKELYKETEYDITETTISIDNKEFIEILTQYDLLLNEVTDSEVIKTISTSILSKYEELVINEHND